MITNYTLKTIYEKILSGEIISTKELISYGLNYYDINKLKEKGILENIERGKYGLLSFESLYNYGIYLINEGQPQKAKKIFQKCIIMNPKSKEPYLYLLYIYIKRKSYPEAYDLLDKIIDIEGDNNKNNLYLYLLSNIYITYPKRYRAKLKNMKNKDLLFSDEQTILKSSYPACNINQIIAYINHCCNSDLLSSIEKMIFEELTTKAQNKETDFYNTILELAKQEQYQKIIDILEKRNKNLNLSTNYNCILIICKKILSILENGKIPSIIKKDEYNVYRAINYNDFKRALSLNNINLNKMNSNKDNDILNILLTKINSIIEPIINEQKFKHIFKENSRNKDIENILEELFQNEIESAIELLREYLKEINQEEYEYLIINLIKISLCERDELFLKPASVLIELSNNEYVYDISIYIQEFYNNTLNNQTGIAKIYLDIISRYSQNSLTTINNLQIDLLAATQKVKEEISQDKELLLQKLEEMKETKETIIILEPMSQFRRGTIYEIIKTIPELIAFSIGTEPKTLVLRYVNPALRKEDFSDKIKKVTTLYYQKDYQSCIELNHQLLQHPKYNPYQKNYAYIYAQLGLSYLNLFNIDEAIKYLTIATELNKEDPQSKTYYDFTDLIYQIKNNSIKTQDDIDDIITVSTEFRDDLNNNYGITQIENIIYYINEEKISLQEACKKFNLTEEQIQLVKLIYARDYYIKGMYQQGDKLLQEVEKSKNKTTNVRNFLNEIRTNKKFYKNRENGYARKLIP